MVKIGNVIFLTFFMTGLTVGPVFAAANDVTDAAVVEFVPVETVALRQAAYLDFLKAKNIEAKIDANGDIQFQHRLQNDEYSYWIRVDPNDPGFFQIFTTGVRHLNSEQELADAYLAASRVNRVLWLTKVCINTRLDDIVVTSHTLLDKAEDFAHVFDILLECLDEGVQSFVAEMRDWQNVETDRAG
jgi:hypothetical protein